MCASERERGRVSMRAKASKSALGQLKVHAFICVRLNY